jgi:peptide-methionine (S)-S-oxide reductase
MTRFLWLALFAVAIPFAANADEKDLQVAIFAGGCFWCVESDFDKVPGVVETVSGYTGGRTENPTYNDVTGGGTGHKEAVRITFDTKQVGYDRLLHIFWRSVDPTDAGGQFCDRGDSYATAIFATSMEQLAQANASKEELAKSGLLNKPVVTPIVAASTFYPAEDYHQDYYTKNPVRYKLYRFGCGRDARIEELWQDQAHAGIPHS